MRLVRFPFHVTALLLQSMALAGAQIWSNKIRSFLTTLGIIIGVASVVGVIAGVTGLKKNVLEGFERFGTSKIMIMADVPDTGRMRNVSWLQIVFRPEEFDNLLTHCPSVKEFTRTMSSREKVQFGGRSEEQADVRGIEPSWHSIERRSVIEGRPFSLIDMEQARSVCIINPLLRDKLHLNKDCTGQSILVGTRRYLIVGLIENSTPNTMFGGGRPRGEVLIPFTTMHRQQPYGLMVVATSRSADVNEEARAEIAYYLRRARRLKPEDPNTFRIFAMESMLKEFNTTAAVFTAVATGVVGISLLVGGIGIMNIMLVSVSERTREIGLRKAVGARPSAILLQFLVEAVTLCLIGGLVGVLLGEAFASTIAKYAGKAMAKAEVPAWAIMLSFGFSAAVGLIFGMFPAMKAARLDPIVALRHE